MLAPIISVPVAWPSDDPTFFIIRGMDQNLSQHPSSIFLIFRGFHPHLCFEFSIWLRDCFLYENVCNQTWRAGELQWEFPHFVIITTADYMYIVISSGKLRVWPWKYQLLTGDASFQALYQYCNHIVLSKCMSTIYDLLYIFIMYIYIYTYIYIYIHIYIYLY